MKNPQAITIYVKTAYLDAQSQPDEERFVFSYTITIENNSEQTAQLLNRHWTIMDSNSEAQEVQGVGVVGEQPHILPSDSYTYTSGVILSTQAGTMEGSYEMQTEDGDTFTVPIPTFSLTSPKSLH